MDYQVLKNLIERAFLELNRVLFLKRPETTPPKKDQKQRPRFTHYSSLVFFFLVLISALNILDSLFTMMILDLKGQEFNPVVRSVMDLCGHHFWIWKFSIVSFSIALLCLYSNLKVVKGIIVSLSSIYLTVVFYQIFLLTHL